MKHKIEYKIKRKEQIQAGAYDGRFRTKRVEDKKKKQARNWARKGDEANLVEATV